ncbi:ATP-grasp domain-containing protein [Cupriavidus basilensis]
MAALGIPHPETTVEMPRDPTGWLYKVVGGTGGYHIRHLASQDAIAADTAGTTNTASYFQRQRPGLPMSALFVAHRRGVDLVGISLQRIAPHHDSSLPVPRRYRAGNTAPQGIASRLVDIIHCIARETSLVGLNSIDFPFDAPDVMVLEVNSASASQHGALCRCLSARPDACAPASLPWRNTRGARPRARPACVALKSSSRKRRCGSTPRSQPR